MNFGFVIGNLGADAEVKESNGKKFITLSIADSRKFKSVDGKEQTVTNWIDAVISDANHPVRPYLQQGVKVCVLGDLSLRVYSSKKDRMMKAGQTIHVRHIELVGGQTDEVPRTLIDPNTAQTFDVTKYYWCNADTKSWRKDDIGFLVDQKGKRYQMNKAGFVVPCAPTELEQDSAAAEDNKEAK